MDDLKFAIHNARESMVRLSEQLAMNNIKMVEFDFDEVLGGFQYLDGYMACLESNSADARNN